MMSKRTELILFDIDGTLLQQRGVVQHGIAQALQEVFGKTGPIESYTMSGKTDPQIMRELMSLAGISDDEIEAKILSAQQAYARALSAAIHKFNVQASVGVIELLEVLQEEENLTLGLLTGNLIGVVKPKLDAARIPEEIFLLGAYGSDNPDRNELPKIAIERAEKLLNKEISPASVLIIGDTPRDIACARSGGTKVISVATGQYSIEKLEKYHPDYVFEDLSDIQKVLMAIGLS